MIARQRLVAKLALVALLPAFAACRRELPRGGPIVLISIDTLRSDRLPAYGFAGVATPAIDALARDGVVFERAYAQVPLTLPSHVAMLTGELPSETGIRDNIGYRFDASRHPYLPQLLQRAGYATGAAVSAYVLRAETGLATGFDFFDGDIDVRVTESLGRSQRPGAETLGAASPWLERVAPAGRFFYFAHLYEPHTPYEPPEPFASRYRDEPYLGEIAAADELVGRLVADLKRLGVYDRATILLVSDHGEGLGDHGELEHGVLLYREAIQVPLIVKLPRQARAGERRVDPVALVDLFPTALDIAGVAAPLPAGARSLLAAPPEVERDLYAETYYPRIHLGWSELTSLIAGRQQYIHGPDPELYDLVADPAQRQNLRASERRATASLRERLAALERPLVPPAEEDPETARRLAALGYLGGATTAANDGPLPDPKSRIHLIADFGRSLAMVRDGRHLEAVALLERLLAENPVMVDGWETLAKALQKLGRQREAFAAYERAVKLSGGSAHIALGAASVLLELKRLDEARQHAELAAKTSPSAARSMLAQIAVAAGDVEAAEREARAALAAGGSKIGSLVTLAQVMIKKNRLEEALALADEAKREADRRVGEAGFPGLAFVRGDALARLGRFAEAEEAFRQEVENNPTDPKAFTRLAVLYASLGRPERAVAVLRALVEGNPHAPGAYAAAAETLRVLGDERGSQSLLAFARTRFPGEPSLAAGAGRR